MRDVVALLPAAGQARRLRLDSGSKEVLPLPGGQSGHTTFDHLLDRLDRGGVAQALVVLRRGKWDIPDRLSRRPGGPTVQYRVIGATGSVPETLAAGLAVLGDRPILLAFPDILYEPAALFRRAIDEQGRGADLVLGLFPTDRPDKSDMVELDHQGRPRAIVIKSARTDLQWAWGLAVWGPRFSRLVLEAAGSDGPDGRELQIGHLVQRAIDRDLDVRSVADPNGLFLDIGTPDDLARARDLLQAAAGRSPHGPSRRPDRD